MHLSTHVEVSVTGMYRKSKQEEVMQYEELFGTNLCLFSGLLVRTSVVEQQVTSDSKLKYKIMDFDLTVKSSFKLPG